MNTPSLRQVGRRAILALTVISLVSNLQNSMNAQTTNLPTPNQVLVQQAFEAWRSGTGGPFALLAPDAKWTITGNSVVARQYQSRQEFLDVVITPFNARLAKPLVPTVRHLYLDGDTVIVLFDGEATASDGQPYRNTYAWFLTMKNGKIVNATAFFDAIAFDDFWKRVKPQSTR